MGESRIRMNKAEKTFTLKQVIPRNTRNRSASSSPTRVANAERDENDERTREERDRIASGTDRDRVGYEGNDSDAELVQDAGLTNSPHVNAAKYDPTVAAPTAK
jgi:hypothetical protein